MQGTRTAADPARDVASPVARIAEVIEDSLDHVVATAVEAIWEQVPGYRDSGDATLRRDVSAHVDAIYRAFLAGLTARRPVRQEDFRMTRGQAMRRVNQGISLTDFLQAYRVAQMTLWDSVLAAAGDDPAVREAALCVVRHVMHAIEVGSTVAAEAYLDAEAHRLAESDRTRRDLLEDLLARRDVPPGPKQAILRAAGLEQTARLLVVASIPIVPLDGEQTLRDVALALTRVGARGEQGLAVVRHEEVVAVVHVPTRGAATLLENVAGECANLRRKKVLLAVGVSTVHSGLREVPEAYAEACAARGRLGGVADVLALPLLSTFDYLTLRDADTARRLIRPEVRRFVEEDAARDGALITTLVEYAACDLNAKAAARRLHLHVNTAYYRLDRIAEKTGYDLRRFGDVVELLIAIRLLGQGKGRPSGT